MIFLFLAKEVGKAKGSKVETGPSSTKWAASSNSFFPLLFPPESWYVQQSFTIHSSWRIHYPKICNTSFFFVLQIEAVILFSNINGNCLFIQVGAYITLKAVPLHFSLFVLQIEAVILFSDVKDESFTIHTFKLAHTLP